MPSLWAQGTVCRAIPSGYISKFQSSDMRMQIPKKNLGKTHPTRVKTEVLRFVQRTKTALMPGFVLINFLISR